MQETEKNEGEVQIDLRNIFSLILKRWWTVLICLVVGAAVGFGIAKATYKPTYRATATYLLTYKTEDTSLGSMTQGNALIKSVMGNCITIVQQDSFMKELGRRVNGELGESSPDYVPVSSLSKYISYTYDTTENTAIYVSVNTKDADLSYRIINEFLKDNFFTEYIIGVYQLGDGDSLKFSLINTPVKPVAPVSGAPVVQYTIIGGVVLALLCCVVWALVEIFDTRIKGVDDIVNTYDLPVLGTVPDFEDKELSKGGYYRAYESKK